MMLTAEDITVIAVIGGLILAFVFIAIRENRRQKKFFLLKIRREWGCPPSGEWSGEDLESISHYTRRRSRGRFRIDEITWNDLEMDDIFLQMNGTVSSCGEDYLYSLLRLPETDPEPLRERNRLTEFFASHPAEREKLQLILHIIGKRKGYSVTDYLDALDTAPGKGVGKYVFLGLLGVSPFVMFFFAPLIAVLLLVLVLAVNGTVHYRESRDVEKYMSCLACILRLLKAAEELGKCRIGEIQEYADRIRRHAAVFRGVRRKSVTLTSEKGVDATGLSALTAYLNTFFMLDFIQFYSVIRKVKGRQEDMDGLLECFGILDSAIAIASWREFLPVYCRPEFWTDGGAVRLQAEDLYHPLIENPVANSIDAEGGVLLTGSNASGKSTFLKTVAVNAILAQSVCTCTATAWRCPMVKTMTSMALRDDVQGGESYYIVEIRSLKRILTEMEKGEPLLCIIDEVLRGTNTIERIAASSRILASMRKKNVLPFAATHDIELTAILDGLYQDYHFEEEITDKDIRFNYLLKKGRASSRNAIALLEFIGYDRELVKEARAAASEFEESGVWKPLKAEGKEGRKRQEG
jgi:DNA mismatch repair ATPase MutS